MITPSQDAQITEHVLQHFPVFLLNHDGLFSDDPVQPSPAQQRQPAVRPQKQQHPLGSRSSLQAKESS